MLEGKKRQDDHRSREREGVSIAGFKNAKWYHEPKNTVISQKLINEKKARKWVVP